MPTKETLEKAFEKIGVKPVTRRTIEGHDILIGDGFVPSPWPALHKFGVEKDEYPNGCYVTTWLWGTDEDSVGLGLPLFFEALHDIDHDLSSRQTMRINAALHSARGAISEMKMSRRSNAGSMRVK